MGPRERGAWSLMPQTADEEGLTESLSRAPDEEALVFPQGQRGPPRMETRLSSFIERASIFRQRLPQGSSARLVCAGGLLGMVSLVVFLSAPESMNSMAHVPDDEEASPTLEYDAGMCHTAEEGETCYTNVQWAMQQPQNYAGLDSTSTFEQFQYALARQGTSQCNYPCQQAAPAPAPVYQTADAPYTAPSPYAAPAYGVDAPYAAPSPYAAAPMPEPSAMPVPTPAVARSGSISDGRASPSPAILYSCLCVFDVDRTLTAKQGQVAKCPGVAEVRGVRDTAYEGGTLVLSQLARHLTDTFCNECYHGIVSAGPVGGYNSKERAVMLKVLGGVQRTLSSEWSGPAHVTSSLVSGAPDGHKHVSVRGIVDWFRAVKGIRIEDRQVYFFDDNTRNPPSFKATSFNARQVSCSDRAGLVGICGARTSEVVKTGGVHMCRR